MLVFHWTVVVFKRHAVFVDKVQVVVGPQGLVARRGPLMVRMLHDTVVEILCLKGLLLLVAVMVVLEQDLGL